MFGKRLTLFKLFGFSVRVDMSWIVIAALVTWSLASNFFPTVSEGLSPAAYWIMGSFGAAGLFVSIIFHELSHSLVARRYGLPMKGITLFIFGGVAEMDDEPPSAKVELLMAIAGPASSIFLSIGFLLFYVVGISTGWPDYITGVIGYFALINGLLAIFNLIPAFPLDGGRVLRAILWSWKQNIRWATRRASMVGSGFGMFLILMGIFALFRGDFVGGIWWFLIGMFLRGAANSSYQQLLTRQALHGEPVSRFMEISPVTVPSRISVQELVEEYIYKYHFKMFPVVDDGELIGCVSTRQIKEIPQEEWSKYPVRDLATQCSADNTIYPDADALEAIAKMNKAGVSRLIVIEEDMLVGVISLKDLLKFLSLKVELENGPE